MDSFEDSHLKTALHYAAQRGRMEVAKLLINKGADVNAEGNEGITPLAIAESYTKIVELLRKHGAKE